METIEYTWPFDKSTWGDGPWITEPDKKQWADEATGYPCLIVRGPVGALCGYVGVSEGHPWFMHDAFTLNPPPDVHGGLTYAGFCQPGPEEHAICHIPAPGESDRVWWVGFDTAHMGDVCPAHLKYGIHTPDMFGRDIYKTFAYVTDQCTILAMQAHDAS